VEIDTDTHTDTQRQVKSRFGTLREGVWDGIHTRTHTHTHTHTHTQVKSRFGTLWDRVGREEVWAGIDTVLDRGQGAPVTIFAKVSRSLALSHSLALSLSLSL
jgi:hypothetical protein